MVSSTFVSAFVAASLLAMTTAQASSSSIVLIPTPTTKLPLNAMQTVGCFKTGVPLEDHGPYDFQSSGNCQGVCVGLKKPVMGLTDGTNCWCGDYLPPVDSKVDDTECDTDCAGFDKEKCGGPKRWQIILSGQTKNRIDNWDPSSASSSSSITSAAEATSAPAKTVVVTPTEAPSKAPKSSGPNKAGIAAGVVVGVVVLVAIVAGVLLILRRRRRRAVEEEYRRQAAVNSFVSGNKLHTSNSSMTDSRLDPEFMMRRQSNGSIADNEDYSRRILKVTNPDGH